jgi:hypothetical protein
MGFDSDEKTRWTLHQGNAMKRRSCSCQVFLLSLIVLVGCANDNSPLLEGPYLGQKPPGVASEIFAPGIISTEKWEGCSCFLNDGNTFIFRRRIEEKPITLMMRQTSDGWSNAVPVPFIREYDCNDFTPGPDGNTLYFTSDMPLEGNGERLKQGNLWTVQITDSGWADPRHLGGQINTAWHESYPSVSSDGTLYFFRRKTDRESKADIYRSSLTEKGYTEPENLYAFFKNDWEELDPFIAPDESYLVFCADREDGYGSFDLYVRFKIDRDLWTDPINMGSDINSPGLESRPHVSVDGKYLFFTSHRPGSESQDIYWVDARIILGLRRPEADQRE